ncbi:MAG: hypothetical protein NVS9B4_07630 [Candidatus Acidiferrum sp.]
MPPLGTRRNVISGATEAFGNAACKYTTMPAARAIIITIAIPTRFIISSYRFDMIPSVDFYCSGLCQVYNANFGSIHELREEP